MKKIVFLFFVLLSINACKKDDPTPTVTSSFGLLQTKILDKSCALSGCHATASENAYKQHNLVLKGDGVYASLVNGSVKNAAAVKANLKQIVPKDLENSFFYQKVNFKNSKHQYGNSMPIGADDLTPNQLKFIEQWINAGAPKEGDVADKTLLN
ncbi:MAG: hypothetical protein RLZZ292_363 [Bacteroidota bacterium]|jgi:predicted DNA binding protein